MDADAAGLMKPKEIAAMIEKSVPYQHALRPSPVAKAEFRLLSWNVDGLASVLRRDADAIKRLIEENGADVLFLQETKLQEGDVEQWEAMCLPSGWSARWSCSVQKLGYAGVAVFWRTSMGASVTVGVGLPEADAEGRCLTLTLPDMHVIGCYVPNSGDGLRRLGFRISEWEAAVAKYISKLSESKPVVYCGDLNVSHWELDLWGNHTQNAKSAGFHPEERKALTRLLADCDLVDSFRELHPDVRAFTYWSHRFGARGKNNGWRLDYVLVSQALRGKLHDAFILPEVAGSDHCPVGCILE